MENTKPTPVTNKGSNNKLLVLAALIALFIATLAYGYYQTKNSKDSPTASNSEWAEFKSEKYGFKFDYPKEWGEVKLEVSEQNKNKYYRVNFFNREDQGNSKSLLFEAISNRDQICDSKGQCGNSGNIEKNNILESIKTNRSRFITYDSDSYAMLIYDPAKKISVLSDYRVVDLPKINVSAAVGTFMLENSYDKCSITQFPADDSKVKCITKDMYSDLDNVLRSIKQL